MKCAPSLIRRIIAAFAHFSDRPQDVAHLRPRVIERLRTIHDKVGAAALFLVRHLLGQEGGKFLLGHARSLEGAAFLDLGRRRDHDNGVAMAFAPGLEQQWNVENDDRGAARLRLVYLLLQTRDP